MYSNIKGQSKHVNDLVKNQLTWLKERNSCETDQCVFAQYKAREAALHGWLQKEAEKAKELESCTDRSECWPEGSAMHTGLTLVAGLQATFIQLKTQHDELIALLLDSPDYNGENYPDFRVISALSAQHISWGKYRTDECELIGSLSGAGDLGLQLTPMNAK